MNDPLIRVCLLYAQLSLLAFGGANTILPDMKRLVVDVNGFMDAHTFAALYALASAAPGPNMMVVSLIGWHVAGLAGAVLSMVCIAGPASVLTYLVAGVWERFRDAPWRKAIQKGLLPVTAGLLISSAVLLIRAASLDWSLAVLTGVVTVVLLRTNLHPLLVLAGAAVLGAIGVVG